MPKLNAELKADGTEQKSLFFKFGGHRVRMEINKNSQLWGWFWKRLSRHTMMLRIKGWMVFLQMSMGGDLCVWHQADYNIIYIFKLIQIYYSGENSSLLHGSNSPGDYHKKVTTHPCVNPIEQTEGINGDPLSAS